MAGDAVGRMKSESAGEGNGYGRLKRNLVKGENEEEDEEEEEEK